MWVCMVLVWQILIYDIPEPINSPSHAKHIVVIVLKRIELSESKFEGFGDSVVKYIFSGNCFQANWIDSCCWYLSCLLVTANIQVFFERFGDSVVKYFFSEKVKDKISSFLIIFRSLIYILFLTFLFSFVICTACSC